MGLGVSRFSLRLLLAALSLSFLGCSQSGDELPREPVAGTVLMDGEPLADGTIQFAAAGGTEGGAVIGGGSQITEGHFSIPRESGLVPGKYKVAIYSAGKRNRTKTEAPGKRGAFAPELVPARYNAKSTLVAEVAKGGTSDLKYELQSK